MKKVMIAIVLVLFVSGQARAADKRIVTSLLLLTTGTAMVFGAFTYDTSCPAGYSTHTFQGSTTQCVYVSSSGSDVRDIPTTATLKRPGVLYGGIAIAAVGAIVLFMPKSVKKIAPELVFTPTGWKASRTFRF